MSTFDWSDYLTLAEELAKRSDSASKRTAISRAYYSIFNIASNRQTVLSYTFSKLNPQTQRPEGSHERIWSLYGRNTDSNCQTLSVMGGRLKGKRVKADYRDNERICEELPGVLADAKTCASILAALDPKYPQHR